MIAKKFVRPNDLHDRWYTCARDACVEVIVNDADFELLETTRNHIRELSEKIEWLKHAYVSSIKLGANDVICVFFEGAISDRAAAGLKEQMEKTFIGNRVAVFGDGLRLGVLNREPAPAPAYTGTSGIFTDFESLPRLLRELYKDWIADKEMSAPDVINFIEWLEQQGDKK